MRSDMAAMADGLSFEPATLLAEASREVALDDFGAGAWEEPFGVLVGELDRSPVLSPVGRVMLHAQVQQLLRNRLLLADLLRRHPEIHEIEIDRPIVIAGLPRTGTTHLHNLIAADPGLRSLPYWESLEPVPLPAEAGVTPDPRLARTDLALWFVNETMPHFKRMHEMTTWHVHEEIQLLAMDFSTMLFETLAHVPGWRDHYLAHDQTPHYRYLKTVLQALTFLRGGTRWVLKSPQHLEQFGPLSTVFPDATFVVTHRDPMAVVTSMATMLAYTARMSLDPVDPIALGRHWADRLETMLTACVRDRAVLPDEQAIDVRFDDFMADDVGMVRRIYDLAGQPFDARAERGITEYMAGHERNRFGSIEYHPEDVGLDDADLARRFAPYTAAFLDD